MQKKLLAKSDGTLQLWRIGTVYLLLTVLVQFDAAGIAEESESKEPVELTLRIEPFADLLRQRSFLRELPKPADLGVEQMIAFEETWSFWYLCGISGESAAPVGTGVAKSGFTANPRVVRRIFVLKPATVIIDDQVFWPKGRISWTLESQQPLRSVDGEVQSGARNEMRCRTLLPVTPPNGIQVAEQPGKITRQYRSTADRTRLVHALSFGRDHAAVLPKCDVKIADRDIRVEASLWDELTDAERVTVLSLPDGIAPGKVNIFDRKGYVEIPTRRLPAGLLPLGEDALQVRLGWDIAYRANAWNTWETGRPSSDLRRLVESDAIRPGRTVELGCGSGNDAIYLARQGFSVTGIDIAPTALNLAEEKAQKARAEVTWLLADVLHPPSLKPFDFIYDRGCYHALRTQHAADYLSVLSRLARPGARILVLAGNANDPHPRQFEGPPRVTEDQIRGDFARGFRLLALREFRFDTAAPDQPGALAWSILLEREADD